MRGVNRVTILGNLGGDAETKYSGNGTAITTINVATSEAWTDKGTGEKQERTEWHRIKFFGKLAEIAGEYLSKGSKVYVEGKLRTDKYDKNGVDTYTTYIVADQMQMLGDKQESGERKAPASRSSGKPVKDCPQPDQGGFDDQEIPF